MKTKQEKKKMWISPFKFLKSSSCVLKALLADPRRASVSTERCPHSCKGLTLRRSKAAATLFMRRWKVSYSGEARQRKPFASPRLGTNDFLLIEPSLAPSALAFVLRDSYLLWKWECKCPHTTGALFSTLFITAGWYFWFLFFIFISSMNHISLNI